MDCLKPSPRATARSLNSRLALLCSALMLEACASSSVHTREVVPAEIPSPPVKSVQADSPTNLQQVQTWSLKLQDWSERAQAWLGRVQSLKSETPSQ